MMDHLNGFLHLSQVKTDEEQNMVENFLHHIKI